MAEFTCTRCGKCCISLGRHMHIVNRSSPFSFTLRVGVTGETLPVQVSPSFRDLFLAGSPPAFEPGWCPFLRRTTEGHYSCTIYPSRPGICRTFRCCDMRILSRDGVEAGRVKGRRSLSTADTVLKTIWDDEIIPVAGMTDEEFRSRCRSVLAGHGYRCEIYGP